MDKIPITLGYWKIRGLAEPIRMLLEYLGVPYKDELYECGPAPEFTRESWTKVKYNLDLEFPNLPYLIDGSLKFTESVAIIRYICNKYEPKLMGTKLEEIAYVDMTMGVLSDLITNKSITMYLGKDNPVALSRIDSMNAAIKNIAKVLEKNKYLVGDKLTFVDFVCAEIMESINDLLDPIFTTYPSIKKHFDEIANLPNIKKYRTSERYLKDPFPYNNKMAKFGGSVVKK